MGEMNAYEAWWAGICGGQRLEIAGVTLLEPDLRDRNSGQPIKERRWKAGVGFDSWGTQPTSMGAMTKSELCDISVHS